MKSLTMSSAVVTSEITLFLKVFEGCVVPDKVFMPETAQLFNHVFYNAEGLLQLVPVGDIGELGRVRKRYKVLTKYVLAISNFPILLCMHW